MTAARAHRILGYLRACVEAEHAASEYLTLDAAPGAEPSLLLERGPVPLGDARVELAPSNRARRWAEARLAGAGHETLWIGWPVVRGHRRVAGRRAEVVAGLLVGQIELVADGVGIGIGVGDGDGDGADTGTGTGIDPEAEGGRSVPALAPRGLSIELGDEALDLLGIPSDERELLRRDFDRALNRGRGDTFAAAVRFLNARDVTTVAFDPRALGPLDQSQVLSNTAVAWVGQAGDAPSTRAVVDDLRRLADRPDDELAVGPLGAVLADTDPATPPVAAEPPPLEPVPGVAPLDLHQEAVIAGALHRPLSVVTVPAGLARTDLIANTVAAAMVRGERVLVVSTNDRALDVVHERLAAANAWASPVRAGHDPQRGATAEAIEQALRRDPDPDRAERYPTWWAVRADIEAPYQSLARRRDLTWRLEDAVRRRTEVEARLPGDVKAEGDVRDLTSSLEPARARASEWATLPRTRPWHRPRVRAAERALDLALEGTIAALDGPVGELARLRLDAGDPLGALDLAGTVIEVLQADDEIGGLENRLAVLPDEATLDAEIEESYPLRQVAAAQLHEDRWANLIDASRRLRSTVHLYRSGLAAAGAESDASAQAELHKMVPDVLEVLPVWVVTTSAVGRWFPLTPDLFDLVIVDDAGQSDIASALPALARARRAMVLGDPEQLAPVSHVTTDLDAQLAGAHGLSEDDHRRLSHRRGSLFSFTARAAAGPPAFLPVAAGVDPGLVALVGGHWYGGRLRAGAARSSRTLPGPALRWVDHRGQFEAGRGGRSGRNASEALAVVDEVIAQLAELRAAGPAHQELPETPGTPGGAAGGGNGSGTAPPATAEPAGGDDRSASGPGIAAGSVVDLRDQPVRSIGVVTLLAAQREALRDLLLERFGRTITVDTPETFQGDERDVVVVSLVIGEGTRRELVELVADDARLNVALSRARYRLVIVGNHEVAANSGTVLAEVARGLGRAAAGDPAPTR